MSMTREEMIARVCEMAEESDSQAVGYYLDNAGEIILNQLYPFDENWDTESELTVPTRYLNLQMRMAVVLLNKRGADGESMHIENGINRHYGAADIPEDMRREIVPKAVMF
jgi:hypothetical protein